MSEPGKPTVIVIHPKERRSKCSVWPLRGRHDLVFWKYPIRGPESLDGYVRLGLGGPRLSMADAGAGLLLLDGTWRWAAAMEREYAELPVRCLDEWVTAYPRTSKLFDDPAAGLATVEALYAACSQTGRSTDGLLDHYQWREQFLALNSQRVSHADRR
jgi:pre-rRNA-processing protein TSR3